MSSVLLDPCYQSKLIRKQPLSFIFDSFISYSGGTLYPLAKVVETLFDHS